MSLRIPVILGSVRAERVGIRAARFMVATLREHGLDPVLVDPAERALPLLDRMYKEYERGDAPAPLQDLADLFRSADAFVLVSAEYNHSIPPALANLLDHFLEEYFWRPSALVCYSAGRYRGVRAAMQLRAMTGELGMPSIPSLLAIPEVGKVLDAEGHTDQPWLEKQAGRFVEELRWYAEALKAKRASGVPY